MELRSPAFGPGGAIPRKYSREAEDISPSLQWTDVPAGTEEFALVCEDPDAPQPIPWVHWMVGKIPADARELAEGNPQGVEGCNDFGENRYGGPMPPPGHGTHHYQFTLYALDKPLDVRQGMKKDELEKAMADHVLDKAELVGTYER